VLATEFNSIYLTDMDVVACSECLEERPLMHFQIRGSHYGQEDLSMFNVISLIP